MQWLPRVENSTTPWRLPLCPGTAMRLVDAIVHAGGKPLSPRDLTEVLARDPALCLWAWAKARADRVAPMNSVVELADWLAPRWFKLIRDESIDPSVFGASDCDSARALAELAARSVTAAHRAAELARDRGLASESAFLLTLLARAAAWIRPSTADFGEFVPSADAASPLGECVRQAWQQVEAAPIDGSASPLPAAEAARADWLKAPSPAGLLTYLAEMVHRQAELGERFEQRLQAARLESLKELAYGAGHEINNPLANISARAQTLLRDEADPARRRMLASIHSQAMRAHEMIADMMLFARPPRPNLAPLDLAELCRQMAVELEPWATQQHTELVVSAPSDPVLIHADRVQLAVALRALCVNSLEALVTGGRIDVSLSAIVDGVAWITVSDNGPGIPPTARTRIFDPYYSGREAGRGLGLGLSKCWRIVTQHGGQIALEESSGPGARFVITLPAGLLPTDNDR